MAHLVVDMLYDFIDGTLACRHADEAVRKSVEYINAHPQEPVLYICDCHPKEHCSFRENGGIWPDHCIRGTRGGSIHRHYYTKIAVESNRPRARSKKTAGRDGIKEQLLEPNLFYKGRKKDREQYSGFEAVNGRGLSIGDAAGREVTVSGIATEYCVKETVMDLLRNGFRVTVLKEALAYVDGKGHETALKEMEQAGARIL